MSDTIIQSPEEFEKNLKYSQAMADIEAYRIHANTVFSEKKYLLERDGIGFSPRGNVCAVAAEKKAGKSWFCMSLAAAATSGNFLGMKAREEGLTVVYFDTEQDADDGQKIQRRVHYANKWDFEKDNDRFMIFHLREADAKERRRVVASITAISKADLVIVDGIRDLLSDFNAVEESASVVQEHMELSSLCKCCIWDVLHVNPGTEKMRGHLGTELGNKVADIIFLMKKDNPNDEDDTVYTAIETDARGHKNIHKIEFRIDDTKPYSIPVLIGEAELEDIEEKKLIQLDESFKSCGFGLNGKTFKEIEKCLRAIGFGRNESHRMIHQGLTSKIIYQHDVNKRYYYNGIKKVTTDSEQLPFERPDNLEEEF